MRGCNGIDGIMSTDIRIDGNNSTKKIIDMINRSRFRDMLQCIMLDGIAVGGFNILDISRLCKETGIPVIAIMRKKPSIRKIKSALDKIGKIKKLDLIRKAGPVEKTGEIYIQFRGITLIRAKQMLKLSTRTGNIPEPIRASHLIASGVVKGESYGNV